jgi:hypothetical protein
MAEGEINVLHLLGGAPTTIADFSSVTQTTLYTVPTGYVCYLQSAFVECNANIGASLQCQIGQNGATTDFVGTTAGDNLDADNDFILMAPVPQATPAKLKKYAAGTVIEFDVTVAGNAVAGQVLLFGILRTA